ncbi:MAG TPA: SHOCT domain-containing protein [Actinomycetota bacterium]|nr:SHOCT domain-containing protein [Actinomycetota bacterium]
MAVMTMTSEVLAKSAEWGPGGWWPIFPLLWLLLLGGVIFVLVRGRRGGAGWHQGQSAEGVLAERYARGEITEEEYKERLDVLKGSR